MKHFFTSTIVLVICILTLISSVVLAEKLNHNYWWQAIGMAIVTFAVSKYYLDQFKSDHNNRK